MIDPAVDRIGYWQEWAQKLHWMRAPTQALTWDAPHATWFADGVLNASANCLDRHLPALADQSALEWEGEDGSQRTLTYQDMHDEVCRAAGGLKRLGVKKGDRVSLYLPMIPELPITMLACARIGAIHNVVFSGFSPRAFRQRVEDAGSRVVVTADGYLRKGKTLQHKQRTDEALEGADVDHVVVVERIGGEVPMVEGRDITWSEMLADETTFEPEPMGAEDPLFMMYTSGTTGKPKGILHTTGGYLTQVYATATSILDLKPGTKYWCMADIGWITGHSYIAYGPLMAGASVVLYEGAPDEPDLHRPWRIVERYGVEVFYTAPTAIRAFMRCGIDPADHDLSTLRLLGTVGEPINPAAWHWYNEHVGGGTCPIIDTWWQTETGAMMSTPLPTQKNAKPGAAMAPIPGITMAVLDEEGHPVPHNTTGLLAITSPWPSMLRTLWQDPDRYVKTYWSKWPGIYFTGDSARYDEDGDLWILGRMDDVMNVSGHRLGTAEMESALVADPAVAEAAVIAVPHSLKGQAPVAFVLLMDGAEAPPDLVARLQGRLTEEIGAIARAEAIHVVADLPKTRSGKIMRRILKAIVAGEDPGDTMTLSNPDSVEALKATVAPIAA